TALFNAEKISDIVAGRSGNGFKTDFLLAVEVEQSREAMLYERAAARCMKIRLLFFFQRMWRMVGGNHVNSAIVDRFQNVVPVIKSFYRRIPLYKIAFAFIVFITEPEMMNAGFSSDAFFF